MPLRTTDTRIAVCGISAILPGGENINESWEMIRAGLDKLDDLPNDRIDVTAYYNPEKTTKDKIYCKRGGFIPDFDFDAREFGMNMFQVEDADTNQTLTLLKVKEAMQDAGIDPFGKEEKNIGVVLGIGGGQKASNEFYSRMNYAVVEKVLRKMGLPEKDVEAAVEKYKCNFPEWRLDSFPGFLGNVTAGRCTNVFNLKGMNCVVDAACASSLTALKVAIDELLHGDADEMICGATCTDCSLGMFMAFSKTPVFSTDPSVTAYDKDTKGMLIGEGSVMLLLKRYEDAVKDGNTIHAVIRGVASSSDGKASGIYSPTVTGQALAVERAYKNAGVSPADVTLVEGHGTGTPVGDRIELTALKTIFEKYSNGETERIAVGSIKSQIGHLKAVAGMAGLVKVIMALKHKVLPASINVKIPPVLYDNTKIQDSPLYINTKLRPWFPEVGKSRIAGVSSFGFGGANYHCVVEEAEPEHTKKPYRMHDLPQPVLLSAATPSALLSLIQAELKSFNTTPDYTTLAAFRRKFALKAIPAANARVGFAAATAAQCQSVLGEIEKKLSSSPTAENWSLIRQNCYYRSKGVNTKGSVAALFSGQGSQYLEMFTDVAQNWPSFREAITKMDAQSQSICGKRISKILYPRAAYANESELDQAEISSVQNAQITTVACSLGAYNIFQKASFKPDFVAGHSLGEFTSLYAAGKASEEDICKAVCHRAKIMQSSTSGKGSMIAVIGKGADSIKITNANVYMGNVNAPDQVVLTGEKSALENEAKLLEGKFKVVKLNVGDAYHSPMMSSANSSFVSELKKINFSKGNSAKMFSNVTGKEYASATPIDMLKDHMTSSVQFINEVNALYSAGARVFVEFGPRNTLTKLVENILKDKSDVFTMAVNSTSKTDAETQLRDCAVQMSVVGVPLENFDPWALENPFLLAAAKKSKTTLRLSAATYVSPKTRKEQERIMNDGYLASCLSSSGSSCSPTVITVTDKAKEQKLEEELSSLKQEKNKLEQQLKAALGDINNLKKRLDENTNTGTSVSASMKDDFVEINTIKKHRDMIVGMLGEYDKLIDSMSQFDPADLEEAKLEEVGSPSPVKIAVAASQPKVISGALLDRAEKVVMQVLAEKTGYDAEMIEPDMELETELGIDSIKRVEILSEVQNILNIEAKDVDALSRTKTVGEVVNAMKFEMAGSSSAASAPIQVASQVPVAKVSISSAPANPGLLNKAEKVVMEVLAEKTGYEIEMIENDMELETELGIDSIKRVEILSEVQNLLNIEAKDVDALSRTKTVGEVVEAMKREISSISPASAPSPLAGVVAPKAQASVSAPVVSNDMLNKAKKVVLDVLAEKTGYEVEMIELDMELETELGIDSIKRVEILSEVQNIMNIEAKDVDALSRTKTVGEVIDAMRKEVAATAVSSAPNAKASVTKTQPPTVTVSGDMLAKAEKAVLDVLAEKTGYDAEMIEKDMELETELGIDSIKRVEILSEVQNILNIEAKDVDALSRTKTVGEVIDVMKKEMSGGVSAPTVSAPVLTSAAPSKSAPKTAASSDLLAKAEKVVLEVLSEKTGYDVEMIEKDMELETELGIDSIKRVEILSEVQNLLSIEAKDVDALSRTKTVGEVIDAMKKEMSGSAPATAPTPIAKPATLSAAPVSSTMLAKAEKAVLDVLAEKTGYDAEMIELDMELETELGIDSIKRVEILSEVQNILNIEAKDVDALARTKTVGEVINVMKKEISGSSIAASSGISTPVVVATPANSSATSTSNGSYVVVPSPELMKKAEKAVLDVLAEKTGYDAEMIELDMELETELGIDSIKRVEILSEVQNILSIEAKDVDALARTKTVGEVINVMKKEISAGSGSSNASTAPTPVAAKTSSISGDMLARAQKVVLDVLAEKTGYEVEMIEDDMELETELGIDSIKRVEILSEVQNLLNIEAKDVDALSRTKTVGEVVSAMKKEMGSGPTTINSAPAASVNVPVAKEVGEFESSKFDYNNYALREAGCEDLNLSFPEVIQLDPPTKLATSSLGSVVVCGSAGDCDPLLRSLKSLSTSIKSMDSAGDEAAIKSRVASIGPMATFVYVHGSEPIVNALIFAKYIRSSFVKGCLARFLVLVRGDGQLGYSGSYKSVADLEKYALCGLCKTISLEWTEVQAKLIDIETSKASTEVASLFLSEALDTNRMLKEVGYRSNNRFGVAVKGLIEGSKPNRPQISTDDVWLVAGGARGITPLCIRELAKIIKGGHYILMGRSQLKPVPEWAQEVRKAGVVDEKSLQAAAIKMLKAKGEKPKPADLRKLVGSVLGTIEVEDNMADIAKYCGGKVQYISCDINDSANVKQELAKLKLKVTGLFHASGVLRDKLIEDKPIEDYHFVYDTKVRGFDNIFRNLTGLKQVVLFSSLAGFYGNAGQSDYSMANEVLNKIAYMLDAQGINAKAFDFGPWDGGMVNDILKAHFKKNNVQIIEREPGATSVAKMMLHSPARQILVGNWGLAPIKPQEKSNTIELIISNRSFLKDHSIQGKPVVPFTFNVNIMLENVLGIYPGYYIKQMKSCKLFRGINFNNSNAVRCKLVIDEISENTGELELSVKLQQDANGDGKFTPSYTLELVLNPKLVEIDSSIASISLINATKLAAKDIYDGVTLFHGPSFQAIEQVKFIDDIIVAKVDLSTASFSGLSVEAILLDAVYQAGLVLARKVGGKASLPNKMDNVKFATDFFNGSRAFQTCYIWIKNKSGKNASVWDLEFKIQDNKVLCEGIAGLTLNEKLTY